MTSNSQQNRIEVLMKDRGWRGALTIFLAERYWNDQRIWRHIDLQAAEIDFPSMLVEGTFSAGERLMVGAACSLYSFDVPVDRGEREENGAYVNLWRMVGRLDEENMDLLLLAITRAANHPLQYAIGPE
ncbi:MAG: hypothetical protein ACYC1S_05295 [Gemmatimonadaceae bacterium]